MHRTARVLAATLATALLAAGCATTKLQAPQLTVMSMQVQSADLFSQRMLVHMRVVNPNARELPVKSIDYRIVVDGADLAQGMADKPFVVPAMGEAEFDVQVTANLATALSQILGRKGSKDTLDYRLIGSVSLSSGFLRRIPFDERGSVKLK
ncbi:MAG TPA: LEA type 2 family protein [Steroidobacteraceae bacterium]|nr:LEA type 2 family protein [Steroidobacteraceae bacterium]